MDYYNQTIHSQKRRALSVLFVFVLCCLWGCVHLSGTQKQTDGSGTSAAQETAVESQSSDYEKYSQKALKAQQDFEELCDSFFREQLQESFLTLHYTLKEPEAYGITDYPISFGDISPEARKKDETLVDEYISRLTAIDSALLTEEQKLTYQITEDALKHAKEGQGMELYQTILAPSLGIQAQLPTLMAEFIFYSKQDVEHYLALLSTIDEYYQQLVDFEREKSQAGLFMPDSCVDQIITECSGFLLEPEHNMMASSFNSRIDALEGLTEEERTEFKARNLELLASDFIPAYECLIKGLEELKGTGTNEKGLCYYPQGKAYYEYLVNADTGTTYTSVERLRSAIENQIKIDITAISKLAQEHPELEEQLFGYEFSYSEPEQILEHLKGQTKEDFPEIPPYHYDIKFVPKELEQSMSPAFFLVPPIDNYTNCVIYINGGSDSSQPLYTILAHEGVPGHLYQQIYFLSHCNNNLRKLLTSSCYCEGWATYVEDYAYVTDNGLSKELGELLSHNSAATLGLYAILDINIHYYGWDKEQVKNYMNQYFSISDNGVIDTVYQAILTAPCNYLKYFTGYLEIINMRNLAEITLKERFNLKEFHQFLLDVGPAPFTIIKPYFRDWLQSYGS